MRAGAAPRRVTHLVVGPAEHGVARHGLGLFAACAAAERAASDKKRWDHRLVHLASWRELADLVLPESDVVQVSFTDALFGATSAEAVEAVARVTGRGGLSGSPGRAPRVSISIHDVPQPAEGQQRFERRAEAYARVGRLADLVVCASSHEAAFFDRAEVVALPLEPAEEVGPPAEPGEPSIGVLGFVYPGKGYERVIEVAPPGVRVRALGAVAEGHESYATELVERARGRGVELEVTGYLAESELAEVLAGVTVPVCQHRHVSASGSLNTWIAHRRRVLVADGPYMREVAGWWPQRVVLTGEGAGLTDLGSAIQQMLAEPGRAWCTDPLPQWGWPEVASALQRLWGEL